MAQDASFFDEYSVDPDGLVEYSVLCTDRSLNQLSNRFIKTMQVFEQAYH